MFVDFKRNWLFNYITRLCTPEFVLKIGIFPRSVDGYSFCLFNTFTRCKLDNRQTYANNDVNSFHSNVLYFQRLQKWRLGWNGLNCFSTSIIIITIYLIGRNEQNFYEHLPWRTYTDNCWSNDMWQSIIRKNKSGDLPLNQIWFKCKKDQLEKDTILAGPK